MEDSGTQSFASLLYTLISAKSYHKTSYAILNNVYSIKMYLKSIVVQKLKKINHIFNFVVNDDSADGLALLVSEWVI